MSNPIEKSSGSRSHYYRRESCHHSGGSGTPLSRVDAADWRDRSEAQPGVSHSSVSGSRSRLYSHSGGSGPSLSRADAPDWRDRLEAQPKYYREGGRLLSQVVILLRMLMTKRKKPGMK